MKISIRLTFDGIITVAMSCVNLALCVYRSILVFCSYI